MAVSAWSEVVTVTTLVNARRSAWSPVVTVTPGSLTLTLGGYTVSAAKFGSLDISRGYLGGDLVWPSASTPSDPPPASAEHVMPANANVVNVVDDYGADPTGLTDSWAAIQAAIDANDWLDSAGSHPQVARPAPIILWFPEGTYLVSAALVALGCSLAFLGAGEDRVTIKLTDDNANFQTGTDKYLLRTGTASADTTNQENAGFANYIHNLTLDIGSGNPAASGCRYSVANTGSIRHVTIKSSDPLYRGGAGLYFGSTAGPGMVADVTVIGFNYGIQTAGTSINDIVLSGRTTLRNQLLAGVRSVCKSLVFEDLQTESVPKVFDITSAGATAFVCRGVFDGNGTGTAVTCADGTYVWLRNITASGFSNLVSIGASDYFVGATSIVEWASAPYRRGDNAVAWSASGDTHVSLNLEVLRAPEYVNSNLAEWACPQDYGYVSGDVGPALRDAIADGVKVIYFPYDAYSLQTDVVVEGDVRMIDFLFSMITNDGGRFVVDSANDVVLQRFVPDSGFTVEHRSANTVVVRDNGNSNSYTQAIITTPAGGEVDINGTPTTFAAATGDLFYESAGANQHLVISQPIRVWVRQMNRERSECNISGGATVWILGDNVELHADYVSVDMTIDDSTVEVIVGAFDVLNYASYPSGGKAAYAATGNSRVSILASGAMRGTTTAVGHWVSDIQGGTTYDVFESQQYDATSGTSADRVVVHYVTP